MFGHYLKVGSSDKGRGYAKFYLGVTSLRISSEGPYKKFNAAPGRRPMCTDFRLVHANAAMHDLFSSQFEI